MEQDDEWAVADRRYFSADRSRVETPETTHLHHLTGHYPQNPSGAEGLHNRSFLQAAWVDSLLAGN